MSALDPGMMVSIKMFYADVNIVSITAMFLTSASLKQEVCHASVVHGGVERSLG